MVVLILFINLIYLYCSCINYKRYIRFVNKFTFTLSYEEMMKMNFIGLEKCNNFIVENFFI